MTLHKAMTYQIWESFDELGGIRYPEQIDIDESDKDWVKMLKWKDLDWEQIGDNGKNIVWLQVKVPLDTEILKKGVVVDIQIIKGTLYQIHITLAEELRGIGLGTKIYRSLVDWLGHIYSGKGRRQNPIINKVWKRLGMAFDITCASSDLGDICVSNKNPMKSELLKIFG